jgi:hypothetical protein
MNSMTAMFTYFTNGAMANVKIVFGDIMEDVLNGVNRM